MTPPPLPQGKRYHVAIDGAPSGPHDRATLESMAGDGRLTRDSLVWTDGMAGWERASAVSDMSGLFGSTPPPLPAQG
jgi:hypothetical protein